MTVTAPRRPASHLEKLLRAGGFAITAEVTPPVSCEPDDLLRKALPLRGLADAVNVTDGAGARTHLDPLVAAQILARNDIEPILQLTCRDRNRIALQAALLGAAACGIGNLLLLSGDDPRAGDQPETKPVFDLDSRALMDTARRLRDQGELPTGRKIGGAARFFIGAADAPIDPPADWEPGTLRAKLTAGADFVQTQFCMDMGVVRRYVERLAAVGLDGKVFVLVGIAPLRSARSGRWMRANLPGSIVPDAVIARMEQAAEPEAEGRRIAVELIEELAGIRGVAGVHVMAPANDAAVPEVIEAARNSLGRSLERARP